MLTKKSFSIVVLSLSLFFSACSSSSDSDVQTEKFPKPPQEVPEIIGGDKDEHGCVASAGYQWSEEKQLCVRSWEEEGSEVK